MPNNRILFYGPPCSGKSTLIKTVYKNALVDCDVQLKQCVAIDLESIKDPDKDEAGILNERIQFVNALVDYNFQSTLFVSAANIIPSIHLNLDEWHIVGLIPRDGEAYEGFVTKRNKNEKQNYMKNFNDIRNACLELHKQGKSITIYDPLDFEDDPDGLLRTIIEGLKEIKLL